MRSATYCLPVLRTAAALVALAVSPGFAAEPAVKAGSSAVAGSKVRLVPSAGTSQFQFETSQMKGTIRLDGAYHGVTRLTDKRTGLQVVDTRYSLLNLFRIFATNLGLDTPRSMKSSFQATADSATITWSISEGHKGVIEARYEVREPNIVDLTIKVLSVGVYPGYDILLPSYFDRTMLPHVYLKRRGEGVDWVLPMVNDAFRGGVLAFPRDEHAARRYLDGRWSRGEHGMPYAPFYPLRHYAEPLGMATDREKKIGLLLLAKSKQCSGVSARYFADKQEDRTNPYSAIDLTLLGEDLVPGDERTVSVRLVLLQLDGDLNRALPVCRAFNKG